MCGACVMTDPWSASSHDVVMCGRARSSRSMPARQFRLYRIARSSALSPAIDDDMSMWIGQSISWYR